MPRRRCSGDPTTSSTCRSWSTTMPPAMPMSSPLSCATHQERGAGTSAASSDKNMPGVHGSWASSVKHTASSAAAASASAAPMGRNCRWRPARSSATPVVSTVALSARPSRRRSFSSASESRVYTGSTSAGSHGTSTSTPPAAVQASSKPSPEGHQSSRGNTRAIKPVSSKSLPYRTSPSPQICSSSTSGSARHSSTAAAALTTRSRSNRRAAPLSSSS